MSEAQYKAAAVRGAKRNKPGASGGNNRNRTILVLPITASAVNFDILGPDSTTLTAYGTSNRLPMATSRIVKMTADVNTFYVWHDESGGVTISETAEDATTPEVQCDVLIANTPVHEYPTGRYLSIKGASTGRLRIVISSPGGPDL